MSRATNTAAHRMVPSISPPRGAERECRLCRRMVSVHLFEHADPTVCSVWCARNDPREPAMLPPPMPREATADTGTILPPSDDTTPADAGTLPWHRDAEPSDFTVSGT